MTSNDFLALERQFKITDWNIANPTPVIKINKHLHNLCLAILRFIKSDIDVFFKDINVISEDEIVIPKDKIKVQNYTSQAAIDNFIFAWTLNSNYKVEHSSEWITISKL